MYVCLCNAVTDSQIAAARDSGSGCIKDLRANGMKICDKCCKCNAHIKEILTQKG